MPSAGLAPQIWHSGGRILHILQFSRDSEGVRGGVGVGISAAGLRRGECKTPNAAGRWALLHWVCVRLDSALGMAWRSMGRCWA